MNPKSNPMVQYQVGGSLSAEDATYVTRSEDKTLYESLQAGEFCYVLNSRQMGKSSLRVRAMQQLRQAGIACADVDLQRIGSHNLTPDQFYAGVIDELIESLDLYDTFDLADWWTEHQLLSPNQRLGKFIELVLLARITTPIVIFVDEIDSVLSLNFDIDDFFALIRNCYNLRADHTDYRRLTFALFGVATPSDLIQDRSRTPFNIGRAIELQGFQFGETAPLIQSLAPWFVHPEVVMRSILDWTGGQPFLTQKVCQLAVNHAKQVYDDHPTEVETWVTELIQAQILENWEIQDEPQHLRTVRDRLFRNFSHTGGLLGLYQQILQTGAIPADDSPEQMELRLSGLVVRREGMLQVYNPIYAAVFDMDWVEQELAKLRPYVEALNAWVASNCQDQSRLLRGQALRDAQVWATGKRLSDLDYRFLAAAQELEKQEMAEALTLERRARELERLESEISLEAKRKALEVQQQANQILVAANHKAERTIQRGFIGLAVISLFTLALGLWTNQATQQARKAQAAVKLEQFGNTALEQFKFSELDALLSAMQYVRDLKALTNNDQLQDYQYPTTGPILALHRILEQIHEWNRLKGHEGKVNSVSFSPDGQLLASVGKDGQVRIWITSGQLLKSWPIPSVQSSKETQADETQAIDDVNFSPNGQRLATAGKDGIVRLWDLQGNLQAQLHGHTNEVSSVSFSPDGQRLATACSDGTIRLWNLSNQRVIVLRGHRNQVWGVEFSPDSQQLASVGEDGTVRLWNVSGQQIAQLVKTPNLPKYSVSFSPTGDYLAVVGGGGVMQVWNRSRQLVFQQIIPQAILYTLSFSPDGQFLAIAGQGTSIKLWQLNKTRSTWTPYQTFNYQTADDDVYTVSFHPQGHLLATAGEDGMIHLWQMKTPSLATPIDFSAPASVARFSPDQQLIVVTTLPRTPEKAIGQISLYRYPSREKVWTIPGHQGEIYNARFTPDGQAIVTAGQDGWLRWWDLQGKLLKEIAGHDKTEIWSIDLNSTKPSLVSAGGDETVKLWNSATGAIEKKLLAKQGVVRTSRFSRDGQYLATAGDDGKVRVWNTVGQLLNEFKTNFKFKKNQNRISGVTFNETKQQIAIVGKDGKDSIVKIYDIAFNPTKQQIATAGKDGKVKLWGISGELMEEFDASPFRIYNVLFSPDGKYLATASQSGEVGLWSLSGYPLAHFEHGGSVKNIDFSKDGKYLLIAGDEGATIQRIDNLNDLLQRGCQWLSNYIAANSEELEASQVCRN